jgi:hypothetical protein
MSSQSEELWRDIPGFPDYYASTLGRIKSRPGGRRKGGILKPYAHPGTGYMQLNLYRDGVAYPRMIHFLVAITFLGPRPSRMEINHKNGDKHDNELDNLEYVTGIENRRHACRLGLCHGRPKLTREMVELIRCLYRTGAYTQRQLARQFQVRQQTISKIVTGKRWPEQRWPEQKPAIFAV